ncbi:Okp1p [Saccharomyces paradoxus]|uniref:Okp1p n=1 Tax=Saccharomyces paradoxus TaxID=27291 RepID=A0A8B8URU8_SACPA|nr:Okp1 [Saccharomyces paradoxus]QHS73483.1 Okp1 [Saccharomyces paradoxus]
MGADRDNFLQDIENDSISNDQAMDSSPNGNASESDSSILMNVNDIKTLRLDVAPESKSAQSKKSLFYENSDDAEEGEIEDHRNGEEGQRHHEGSKQLRFEVGKESISQVQPHLSDGSATSEEGSARPWEFRKVIQAEYRERLPRNYELKHWKKPSKIMIESILRLLETNTVSALDSVFKKYEEELSQMTHGDNNEVERIYSKKERLLEIILTKINKKLRQAKFPSRISERDLDIEYIYSKRQFIQNRYSQELQNCERLEANLSRERKLLEETRKLCRNLKTNNKKRLTEKLIQKDLHPVLNKAMEYSYGLESANGFAGPEGQVTFKNDSNELNLMLNDPIKSATDVRLDKKEVLSLLPSLQEYTKKSKELKVTMDQMISNSHEQEIKEVLVPPHQAHHDETEEDIHER